MGRKAVDLTGQRFGRLVAVEQTDKKSRTKIWKCKCDCGNYSYVQRGSLIRGKTKSCGCLRSEIGYDKAKMLGGKYGNENLVKQIEKVCVDGTRLDMLKSRKRKNNTSGIKGVSWSKRDRKWVAYISFQQKQIHLGCFDKLEDAAAARKEAEEKYFAPILEKYGFSEK